MPKIIELVNKCNKCGKPQAPNKEKSTKDWEVYDCGVKCECGGDFRFLPK